MKDHMTPDNLEKSDHTYADHLRHITFVHFLTTTSENDTDVSSFINCYFQKSVYVKQSYELGTFCLYAVQ